MPLDESLYQQHHRVLARIDQLGKGAASRLPPEAVAQIKALEAQLATAQGEADDLRAQLAHELGGELSRDELMEALSTTKADLEASQQALRASEAARDAAVAQAASAVAREQQLTRDSSQVLEEVGRLRLEVDLLRAHHARGLPNPETTPRHTEHPELEPPYSPRAARLEPVNPRAARPQTVDGLLGGRRPLTSRPQTAAGEGEGISWERKSRQLEVANERLQTALAAATCGLDGRAPPSAAASPRGRGALCRGSPRARPGSFAPFLPA